jgi:methionyl aminopeptidase
MAIIIKSPEQIEGIRKSCQLAADTLDYLEQFVKPGVTTQQINDEAEKFIRSHGAIPAPLGYYGFPKAVCTSMNEVICHGIPNSEDVLEEGDIINVDVTTILNGYFGDTCRMYTVGEISNEVKELLSVARDCLEIGIAQVRPGSKFGNIGKAISDYVRSRGYSVVYQFCGHGVGLKFHEEPQVHHDDRYFMDIEMKPGMIFTIEPMINAGVAEAVIDLRDKWTVRTKDGKLSAQYEHTVLVTDSGVEVLTKSTTQLLKTAG